MADNTISFKNFMLDWFKAYHLSQMDEPRRERWKDLRGKNFDDAFDSEGHLIKRVWLDDKRTSGQKGWADKEGNLNTKLPEPNLSDEDWENFYTICRDTIRTINSKREDLRRAAPDAPFPIDKWFATKDSEVPYKAFSSQEVDTQKKETFKKLADLITKSVDLQQLLSSHFNDDYSFGTFLKDLQSGDYSKHPTNVIKKLQETLSVLRSNLNLNYQGKLDNISRETVKKLVTVFGITLSIDDLAVQCDSLQEYLNELYAAIDPENEKIDPRQLVQFKDPSVYKEILKALYAPDKDGKKSAFYTQFASNGGIQITNWMSESVDGNNYETGPNALIPKFEEERDLAETWDKKWSDFKDEHFKRFTDRAARHIYVEPKAKTVIDAIGKEKLSPKDGLVKILEKKDAILKRVQSKDPSSSKGAAFLFEALEYIKSSGDMDKAFEGALRNGRKAQAIAFEIMKYAMNKGKVAEAKVALETLAVMRYDTFTSAHWDKVKEANKKISIFGDEKLSWNKNEGVKIVTTVMDKTIGFGINTIFWAAVTTRNKIQHARGKISTKEHFRLSSELVNLKTKADTFDNLGTANEDLRLAEAEKNTQEHNIGISVHDWEERRILEQESKDIQQEIDDTDTKQNNLLQMLNNGNIDQIGYNTEYNRLETAKQIQQQKKRNVDNNIAIINHNIQSRGNIGNTGHTHTDEINRLDALQNDINQLQDDINTLQNDIAGLQASLPGSQSQIDQKEQELAQKQNDLQTKEQEKENNFMSEKRSYDASVTRYRVAKELQSRLQSKADKDQNEATDLRPYSAPKNPMENLDMLIYFWNVVNGYEDMSVESYNFFRSVKDQRKEVHLDLDFAQRFDAMRSRLA